MTAPETPAQRAARRYGPLGVIVLLAVAVGVLVSRTSPPATTTTGSDRVSTPGTGPIVDDGK